MERPMIAAAVTEKVIYICASNLPNATRITHKQNVPMNRLVEKVKRKDLKEKKILLHLQFRFAKD